MTSQVDISQIGIANEREAKAVHLAAWTQAKIELSELLDAIVPGGGSAGFVLTKLSNASFDMGWTDAGGVGGGGGEPLERITPEAQGFAGGTDDASAFVQAAIDIAKGEPNKVLWLTDDYYVNALTCDEPIKIAGGGLLRPFVEPTEPLLKIAVVPRITSAVLSITDTTIDLNGGGEEPDTNSTRIELASVTGYFAGMPVRLTSEDQNPAVTTDTNYLSANACIASVSSPYIYLDQVLPNSASFATNPKLHVWDERVRAEITDLRFFVDRTTAWVTNSWDFDFLWLEGLASPIVQGLRFENVTNSGITLMGCLASDISLCDFQSGRGRADLEVPGYGVQDCNGYLNRVRGSNFKNLRHGVTTIGSESTADLNNPWLFGGTEGMLVFDCVAQACSGSGFDTHDDARFCVFSRNTAYGGWAAIDSAYAGYQLRGDQCAIIDCQAINTEYGIVLHNNSANENHGPHIVHGCRLYARKAAFRVRPTAHLPVIIRDCDLKSRSDRQFDLGDCSISAHRMLSKAVGSSTFSHFILDPGAGQCNVELQDGTFDSTESTGTNNRLFQTTGANIAISAFNPNILTTVGQGWAAVVYSTDSEDITAHFDVFADRAPSNASGAFSLGAASVWTGRLRVAQGLTSDTSVVSVASSGGNRTLSEHVHVFCEDVVIAFTCTTADTTINAADAASVRNQRITVINRSGSTHDLILDQQPSSRLQMLEARTLEPGASAILIWNPVDDDFNLASSPLVGAGGGSGIDIEIDGVAAESGASAIDFEADDFTYTGGQIRVDTTNIPRNTWTTDQNANGQELRNIFLQNSADEEQSASSSSGAITLDPTTGNVITTTMSENITAITIANMPDGGWIEWVVTHTGAHTIAFPASTRWEGGAAPTLSASGNVDRFFIVKRGSLYDWSASLGYPST